MTLQLLEKQSVPSGEEDVRQYLRDIRQFPLLTPQEERLLAQRCAEGDEEAIRRMVDSNLRLVVSVAREYAGRGVPLMDLVQEGSIGLLAAVRRFDYTMDFRFSTYATKWIRQGITRCLVSHGLIVEVGRKESIGRPILYGTTEKFLQHFALTTLSELPRLEAVQLEGGELTDFGHV